MKTNTKTSLPTSDVKINEFGLVIVDKSEHEVGNKIALNYLDAKLRIKHALAIGKTVVFLPGTYDLLHAGHVIWFRQALEKLLSIVKVDRNDVFSVVPFDNDKLTRIKKIHRHVSYGGKEVYLRPIINEKNRAVALANLPYIDLVMPIPSPLDNQDLLLSSRNFNMEGVDKKIHSFLSQKKITKKDGIQMRSVLRKYQKMTNPSELESVKEAFLSSGFLTSEPKEIYQKIGINNKLWNNAAWQLVCFLYKMDKEFFEKYNLKIPKVYRLISKWDGYEPQVSFLMNLAGIKTISLKEDFITSTTQIIKENNTKNKMDNLIRSSDPRNYRFW